MRRLLVAGSIVITLLSCNQTQRGCTDYSAENYDPSADVYDHSCVYSYDILIYWNSATYTGKLTDLGSTTLYAYLDDELIGTSPSENFATGSVNCYSNFGISYHPTKYYDEIIATIRVEDQAGNEIYNNKMVLQDGCNEIMIN